MFAFSFASSMLMFSCRLFQGGGRGGRGPEAPNVNDELSFPSLG